MDPSSIVLATVGLLVLSPFALVVWAKRNALAEFRNSLNASGKQTRIRLNAIRRLLSNGPCDPEVMLEQTYRELQSNLLVSRQFLEKSRQSLQKSLDAEKELNGRLQAAKDKVERLEQHLARTPDDESAKEILIARRETELDLENRLA